MDAWSDVEGAIQAAIKQRTERLEKLVAASSMLILVGAIWLVWPTLICRSERGRWLTKRLRYADNHPNLGASGSRYWTNQPKYEN